MGEVDDGSSSRSQAYQLFSSEKCCKLSSILLTTFSVGNDSGRTVFQLVKIFIFCCTSLFYVD